MAGTGPMPMTDGIHARDGRADDARQRPQPELARPGRLHEHERRGAIVDARRVAGRDGAALAEGRPQAGQARRPWCPAADARRARRRSSSPPGCGTATGTIWAAKRPASTAAAVRCWLASAKASWSSRLTSPALGHDLRRLAERDHRVRGVHARVDEAPAQRRVGDLRGAPREGALGLELHVRRPRHRSRRRPRR